MADLERVHLLGRVAHMYYEQSATQEAIASTLNISRPTVSRLLKEAREEGVVRIIINSPFRYVSDLEIHLMNAFAHLKQVRVLQTSEAGTVARAAASYVGSIVRDGDVIGVSWGYTMDELSQHLPNRSLRGATVVQLNGGVARAGNGTNAHEIVARFGRAFGADTYYLNVPAIVDSAEVRHRMVHEIFNKIDHELAVRCAEGIGIAPPTQSEAPEVSKRMPEVSIDLHSKKPSVESRRVAILAADGYDHAVLSEVKLALKKAGLHPKVVAKFKGQLKGAG
ncbi:MAG: sugar-binding domain-containing protein, partial [Pseudarthrobacter sp.]